MKYLVISCSLNKESRSKLLAKATFDSFKHSNAEVEFLDLLDYSLPPCDGEECYDNKVVKDLIDKIKDVDGIIMAVPVYNYDVNSAAKLLIELTGEAWKGKTVGFVCASGGQKGYMAVMGIINSLMLDFRCIIIPKMVYASSKQFDEDKIKDKDINKRIDELVNTLVRVTNALSESQG